jgi:hypothetical protein
MLYASSKLLLPATAPAQSANPPLHVSIPPCEVDDALYPDFDRDRVDDTLYLDFDRDGAQPLANHDAQTQRRLAEKQGEESVSGKAKGKEKEGSDSELSSVEDEESPVEDDNGVEESSDDDMYGPPPPKRLKTDRPLPPPADMLEALDRLDKVPPASSSPSVDAVIAAASAITASSSSAALDNALVAAGQAWQG